MEIPATVEEKESFLSSHEERSIVFFQEPVSSPIRKGDKMPVAIHTIMEDYTSHRIMLQKGDRLFLFSDGYADQFGGPEHRKFMAKNFKSLIARTSLLPIVEQGHEIDATFQQWKDFDGSDYEQIDDVTVLGFEV